MSKLTLWQGNCLELMSNIEDNSVDLILCDLPYGTTACKWDTVIPFDLLWEQYNRITKEDSAIVLFGQEPFSSHLRMSNLKMWKYDWIWYKNRPSGVATAKYKPMVNHEIISVFCKTKTRYYPIKEERDLKPENAHLKEKEFTRAFYGSSTQGMKTDKPNKSTFTPLRYPTTVKRYDAVSNHKGNRLHPTQKPIDLLEYLVNTYTLEGDIVLDNTMGSGSTGVACQNTNRRFIGIEQNEEYYNIACKRMEENLHSTLHLFKVEKDNNNE